MAPERTIATKRANAKSLQQLDDFDGQRAATAIGDACENIHDAIECLEVALYNIGLTEEAAERIAIREATRATKDYKGD